MTQVNPNYDCPECGEPALVNTSTNFKHEWTCSLCDTSFDPALVR